uniref:Uncharacterized protein n=1 Tax=viral metagenome TaxID=1070528 RepID=A0A6C0B569_9ZZZZ
MSGPVMRPIGGFQDRTTYGAVYGTESVSRIVNVDTRFRDNPTITGASACTIRLPRTYKNITSLRLSSIELPNTWYDFTANLENTNFTVSGVQCTISDGNYNSTTLAAAMVSAAASTISLSIGFDSVTTKCTISASGAFTMDFTPVLGNVCCITREANLRPFDTGLGSYLGFTSNTYSGNSSYTSETLPNLYGNTYVLLSLEKYEAIDHLSFNGTSTPAFAKIVVSATKNSFVYSGVDTITNKVILAEPENVSVLKIKLTDCYGRVLQTFGNFSFTLEMQEVVSSKLYSAYKDNLAK